MAQPIVDEVALREPRLLVPVRQPLGRVCVDRANPLARELRIFGISTGAGVVDACNNSPFLPIAGAISGAFADSIASNCNGSSQYFESTAYLPKIPFTFAVVAWTIGTTNNTALIGLGAAGTGDRSVIYRTANNGNVAFFVGGTDYSQYTYTDTGLQVAGARPRTIVGVYNAANNMPIYIDGIAVSTTLSRASSTFSGTVPLSMQINAYRNNTTLSFYGTQKVCAGALWNRALNATEILKFHNDPYEMLIPA